MLSWQVHGPGADIDTLCVGPSYVNRDVSHILSLFRSVESRQNKLNLTYNYRFQEDFFIILHNILAEMEEVTELQPVQDAHVPVMKFKFLGISVDLLYASISLLVVPEVSFFCASILFLLYIYIYIFVGQRRRGGVIYLTMFLSFVFLIFSTYFMTVFKRTASFNPILYAVVFEISLVSWVF